jgi:hypothetical protein
MTRGHCGSLALQRGALSSPPPCRFIPAHPEPERARKEIRLEHRLQHQLRRLLRHPVTNRGNAERPLAPSEEALDTPLSPPPLSNEPGPATGRSGAYPDRTLTCKPGPAFRTHHARSLASSVQPRDPGDTPIFPGYTPRPPGGSRAWSGTRIVLGGPPSGPGESHPRALTERSVKVSLHSARLIYRPFWNPVVSLQWANMRGCLAVSPSHHFLTFLNARSRLYFRRAQRTR